MRRLAVLFVTAVAAVAGACTGTVHSRGALVATSDYYEPDLVYISPGVSVIADYDEPVFYSDNFYWRYYGGSWYRSPYYNRGWVHYSRPPLSISRIDRPYSYRNYRPHGYTVRRGVDRRPTRIDRDRDRSVIRDHRDRGRPVIRGERGRSVIRGERGRPVIRDRDHDRRDHRRIDRR